MPVIQCPNGHYYDTDKNGSCPWCGVQGLDDEATVRFPGAASERTVPFQRQAVRHRPRDRLAGLRGGAGEGARLPNPHGEELYRALRHDGYFAEGRRFHLALESRGADIRPAQEAFQHLEARGARPRLCERRGDRRALGSFVLRRYRDGRQ